MSKYCFYSLQKQSKFEIMSGYQINKGSCPSLGLKAANFVFVLADYLWYWEECFDKYRG